MSRIFQFCQTILAILVYTFLYLPIVVLVAFSFNRSETSFIWDGFTLEWYIRLLDNGDLIDAALSSLTVAMMSTFIATIIGTLAAYGLSRYNFFGERLYNSFLHLPLIVPDIILGISLLSLFSFLNFTLGHISIVLSHTTFNIAFVAIVVRARLSRFDWTLEQAAADLGAGRLKTLRYVTLPLSMPGIAAGALLAFMLSWDDFLVALFTSGVGATTLPLKVYSLIKFGVSPEVNALSSLMILLSIITVSVALFMIRKNIDSIA